MPSILERIEIPRRVLTILYILDTSGSMSGAPIATLNHAMTETIDVLKEVADSNADAMLKINVLTFNSSCKWMALSPVNINDFTYEDLSAGGMSSVGEALRELNDKLSSKDFLNSPTGNYVPIIIFMSDGFATDDYKASLALLLNNRWFSNAIKIGFAIGSDPDIEMISSIVGNIEAVIRTEDLDIFARLLRFVSVRASLSVSSSRIIDDKIESKDIVKTALDEIDYSESWDDSDWI